MNSKGKEQIAKKIVKTIKVTLNKKKSDPIMTKDKEELGANSEGTETETITAGTKTKHNSQKRTCKQTVSMKISKQYIKS
jgi:hypothetical protein